MMHLKNLKLGTKLTLGFGFVLFTLVLSIFFGYSGLKNINDNFHYYTQITLEDQLAGKIQSNLLSSRIAFKNYIQSGDEKYSIDFKTHMALMESAIIELEDIHKLDRQDSITNLRQLINNYKSGFDKLVEYKQDRNALYDQLAYKGPEIERHLSGYLDDAFKSDDIKSQYGAINALKNLLKARIYVSKFIENNDKVEAEAAITVLAEFDQWLQYCLDSTNDINNQTLLEDISDDKETYLTAFLSIVKVIENRNLVLQEMDTIGPQITQISEEIQLSIISEQEAMQPVVQKQSDRAVIQMLSMSVFAFVISVFMIIVIILIVVEPVKMVTSTFKEISEGEANLKVRLNASSEDELGHMAKYFNRFMVKLEAIINENKKQSWLKTGQVELNEKIKLEQDMEVLTEKIITYISEYVGAQIGVIYIKEDDQRFKRVSSYACRKEDERSERITVGEGIVGQVALEKQTILIKDIPDHYIKIYSGLGEALPKNIIVTPCVADGDVKCIIELGSFQEFNALQQEFIEQISDSIATSIQMADSRVKLRVLLNKSLEQAEELQVQQEELRQTNEELEEQTKALKESEAQLQVQQEELRVVNEELEERTKSLELQKNDIASKNEILKNTQKDIEEKAKALEVASKYKSEFLANMSHELRTPLNSILVLSQLLAQGNDTLSNKQIEFANTIHSSGEDLLKLINDILDLSKVEAGKLDVVMEAIDIKKMISAIEKLFKPIAMQKGLFFNVEVSSDVPTHFVSDYQRIQQILKNLLSNAFKFTDDGGVTLIVQVKGTSKIYFTISDTGIGIAKDKQDIIFEAFKQSDGTTSRKYGGTGLGLSISKELAQLLGVKINVDSELGKGSTFTLEVPLNVQMDDILQEVAATEEPDSSLTMKSSDHLIVNDVKTKQLLIIEDDINFSNVLLELAEMKGYKAIIAENGEDGIELAIQKQPDAILLDIGLPDINGWKVIDYLKNETDTSDIPVHIITGKEINSSADSLKDIIGYMKKPVSLNSLDSMFNKIEMAISKPVKRLLIVDQNEDHTTEISTYFKDKDIQIITKHSGSDALQLLKEQPIDCMILDIKLKDMTGFELLEKIKDENMKGLPVLIHTEKDLTLEDEMELRKYAESIVIKGDRSIERLIAETSLFLHNVESKMASKYQPSIKTQQENEETFKNKTILVVDDDMRNVFTLSSILEEKGMKVIVGRNGAEGIQKLRQNQEIDLILMDIMMPEMDGYTAMAQIRKDKTYRKIPIIALTAKAMKEDRQKCIEAGANDYLTKPINIDQLNSLLRVWLYK